MGKKWVWIVLLIVAVILIWIFLANVFSGKLIVSRYILKFKRFELRWYSTLITLGILIDYFLARWFFKRKGWNIEHLDEALLWGVVLGIICSRAYYVIFEWNYFKDHPSEIPKIWHGGIAIHGGFLGAILAVWLYTKFKKDVSFSFLEGLDVMGWLFPLGQGIGRWGNFFNYEAFGVPTDLPWKMFVPEDHRPVQYVNYEYFHPTFLYESVWDFMVFAVLTSYMLKHYKKPGEIVSLYMVMYSMGRIMTEVLRTDSLWFGNIRAAQLFSAVAMLLGSFWYLYLQDRET